MNDVLVEDALPFVLALVPVLGLWFSLRHTMREERKRNIHDHEKLAIWRNTTDNRLLHLEKDIGLASDQIGRITSRLEVQMKSLETQIVGIREDIAGMKALMDHKTSMPRSS